MVQKTILPDGWGEALLYEERTGVMRCPRSYDNSGKQLIWHNNFNDVYKTSCDVESIDQPQNYLMGYYQFSSANDFFASWVATEASAKLFDIPILYWLKNYGMIKKAIPLGRCIILKHNDSEYELLTIRSEEQTRYMAFAKMLNYDLIKNIN